MADKDAIARSLRADIEAVIALRADGARDTQLREMLPRLKAWQSARLARTYADLFAHERYRPATVFFLEDLYGPGDFRARDEQFLRVVPMMRSMLPAGAMQTVAAAVRLDRLSESLDQGVARALCNAGAGTGLDEAAYAASYRAAGRAQEREQQLALTIEICTAVDELTNSRSLRAALALMRKPARVAGLGALQDFLERGFAAFRHMRGADEFLATIEAREREAMRRLFAAHPRPFERPGLPV